MLRRDKMFIDLLVSCALFLWVLSAHATHPAATMQRQADLITLFDLTGIFDSERASVKGVVERFSADYPSIPPEVWQKFASHVSDREVLISLYTPIYRKHLSQRDVHEVVAFYQTGAGSRLLERGPAIQAESRQLIQTWILNLMTTLLQSSGGSPQPSAPNLNPASSVPTDAIESTRLASVHELLRVSGTLAEAKVMALDALARMEHAARNSQTDSLPPAFWDGVRMHLSNDDELLQLWTPAYDHAFTDTDIHGLIDFYRSPLGIRFVRAMSLIHAECTTAATTLANEAARKAIREVLGPLPQWRLMHPNSAASAEPGSDR